jgi:hypothetical protein
MICFFFFFIFSLQISCSSLHGHCDRDSRRIATIISSITSEDSDVAKFGFRAHSFEACYELKKEIITLAKDQLGLSRHSSQSFAFDNYEIRTLRMNSHTKI